LLNAEVDDIFLHVKASCTILKISLGQQPLSKGILVKWAEGTLLKRRGFYGFHSFDEKKNLTSVARGRILLM